MKIFLGRPRPGDDENNAATLWAYIHHLEATVKCPDGLETRQDVAIAERSKHREEGAEVEALRETNRRLQRRLQAAESPVVGLELHAQRMSDRWLFEFKRLSAAHGEIRAIFLELARVQKYPQDAISLHSVMDSHQKEGIWASCLKPGGGAEEFRVLDEVRKIVRRLEVAESLFGKTE